MFQCGIVAIYSPVWRSISLKNIPPVLRSPVVVARSRGEVNVLSPHLSVALFLHLTSESAFAPMQDKTFQVAVLISPLRKVEVWSPEITTKYSGTFDHSSLLLAVHRSAVCSTSFSHRHHLEYLNAGCAVGMCISTCLESHASHMEFHTVVKQITYNSSSVCLDSLTGSPTKSLAPHLS